MIQQLFCITPQAYHMVTSYSTDPSIWINASIVASFISSWAFLITLSGLSDDLPFNADV